MMSIFAFIAIVLTGILISYRHPDKTPESRTAGVDPKDPAMVIIDTESASGDQIPDAPDRSFKPEDLNARDEATAEELNERLDRMEGMMPEKSTGYIFVGDSRFVHMDRVCHISDADNLFMAAKVGAGYPWFSGTAVSQIKKITSSGLFDKYRLIICMGVNDLEDIDRYKQKIDELKTDYDISLVSVNPITSYGTLSNERIESFNSKLKESDLPYIDTCRLLMLTGFTTTDGLHYDADTSEKIFRGILMGLEDENPSALTDDTAPVLDKASAEKKKSLQKAITDENVYVKEEVSENLLPIIPILTEQQQPADNTVNEAPAANETAPPAEENAAYQLTEADIDALYGITRDEGSSDDEEEEHEDSDDDE